MGKIMVGTYDHWNARIGAVTEVGISTSRRAYSYSMSFNIMEMRDGNQNACKRRSGDITRGPFQCPTLHFQAFDGTWQSNMACWKITHLRGLMILLAIQLHLQMMSPVRLPI